MIKHKPSKKQNRHNKLPLWWVVCSWLGMLMLGAGLFKLMLMKQGVSFPIAAGQSTDPYFFAFLVAVIAPLLLILLLFQVLKGIIQKRSALEIAKEVGKDIAVTVVQVAAESVLDSLSSGSSSNKASSSSDIKGGGGSSGGAGASGEF